MPPRSPRARTLTGLELALHQNDANLRNIEKRAFQPQSVLGACLDSYMTWLEAPDAHPLSNLTHHLVSTVGVTEASIRSRFELDWMRRPDATAQKIESSVTNSMRRSAGTNYQSLISYALARYLKETKSSWYVVFPVPSDFAYSLGIKFGTTQPVRNDRGVVGTVNELLQENATEELADDAGAEVVVKPDLDIMLRNASWSAESSPMEPIFLLSVKTSLADRAGSAARWKTYFDLVTRPCQHACEDTCAYGRLGMGLATQLRVSISHGIVTANIYKINSDPKFREFGELRSNQAKANTFMFDLRYTTRDDSEKVMAEGWSKLPSLIDSLAASSIEHGMSL